MTLEQITEQAVQLHEQTVRECIEIDYAWKVDKLDEWVERKYQQLMGASDGGPEPDGGTDPPT